MTEPNDVTIDKPWANAGVMIETVTDVDLSLDAHLDATPAQHLRMRRLTVAPGGVVAYTAPADRVRLIRIDSGHLLEFRDDHDSALEHHGGSILRPETGHWWRNNSDQPSVMLWVDLAGRPSST